MYVYLFQTTSFLRDSHSQRNIRIERPFYMLHALPISSYSFDHPNNFCNEHKLIALITLLSSPASGFFSLDPNAFRRTAELNDNLKAMVIMNKPINGSWKDVSSPTMRQLFSCETSRYKNRAIKRNEKPLK